MSTKKKYENIAQLDMLKNNYSPNPYWSSSLFNEVYLKNDVPRKYNNLWENDEFGGFYDFYQGFISLCASKSKEDFNRWNEVDTITNWIRPVMALLGWEDPTQPTENFVIDNESFTIIEDGKKKTYRPDLMYFDDPEHKKYLQRQKSAENKLREARNNTTGPKIMLEAKYWDRLEEYRTGVSPKKSRNNGNKDETTKSLTPDDQCLKYMNILKHDFGILTDGKTWRLFHRELSEGSVKRNFEFDLGNLASHAMVIDKENHYETFLEQAKYFYYFFSKESHLDSNSGMPFVYQILEYSKKYASEIEEDLRKKFVVAMGHACNAIKESISSNEADLDTIRNVAESHLFNILFVKSCETRKILPLNAPDYLKISISEIVDTLDFMKFDPDKNFDSYLKYLKSAFGKNFDFDTFEIYDRVLRLYKVVHDGSSSKDDFGFEIEGFRESVFSNDEWEIAQKHKINNRAMLNILSNLMFTHSNLGDRKYQQIPYNYFTPRQLGSIYESFLEFKLEKAETDMVFHAGEWKQANLSSKKVQSLGLVDHFIIKKGSLFFTPDNVDRKMTGSYYTPDYVVRHMLKKVLGPKLDKAKTKDMLKMKIVDPSMGSGHFLSGALDYLTNIYREKLSDEKMDDISETFEESSRRILDACIYGCDLNPRAVKLAKMSLWLLSAFPGKKLERLDDQLKNGDSLFISWPNYFPRVFKGGKGFDAVIGNPPWVQSKTLSTDYKNKLKKKYVTATANQYDLFCCFTELSSKLIDNEGIHSFIVPNRFFTNSDYKIYREYLLKKTRLSSLYDLGDGVFEGVTMPSCIYILSKGETKTVEYKTLSEGEHIDFSTGRNVDIKDIILDEDYLFKVGSNPLLDSLCEVVRENGIELKHFVSNARGVEIGKKSPVLVPKQKNTVPFLIGSDISRYSLAHSGKHLKLGYEEINYKEPELYKGEKILLRKTGHGINATIDRRNYWVIQVIYIFKKKKGIKEDLNYILGLINSSLMYNYYYETFGEKDKKAFPHFRQTQFLQIPIKKIDWKNKDEIKLHNRISKLVQDILDVNKSDELSQKKIKNLSDEIDKCVLNLYGFDQELEIDVAS